MTHTTPTATAVWGISSSMLGGFLLWHLWHYDRFRCLKWSAGPYQGAFKRFMTYSYLMSIPLIMTFSIGLSYIKYKQGFTFLPGFGIIPTPYQLWPQKYQNAIFPLYFVFSLGWALELINHLEELCFWQFLMNSQTQADWFKSVQFKVWLVGTVAAMIYMPVVTSVKKSNPLMCEAFTFLAGSLGDLCLTVCFLPILYKFPGFLRQMQKDGADRTVIKRLTKFNELNVFRIIFRFFFVIPLLILAIDGVKGHTHKINENLFWTDFLIILAAFGCVISSAITLMIFFPRSYDAENPDEREGSDNASRDSYDTAKGAPSQRYRNNQQKRQQRHVRKKASKRSFSSGSGFIQDPPPDAAHYPMTPIREDTDRTLTNTPGITTFTPTPVLAPTLPPLQHQDSVSGKSSFSITAASTKSLLDHSNKGFGLSLYGKSRVSALWDEADPFAVDSIVGTPPPAFEEHQQHPYAAQARPAGRMLPRRPDGAAATPAATATAQHVQAPSSVLASPSPTVTGNGNGAWLRDQSLTFDASDVRAQGQERDAGVSIYTQQRQTSIQSRPSLRALPVPPTPTSASILTSDVSTLVSSPSVTQAVFTPTLTSSPPPLIPNRLPSTSTFTPASVSVGANVTSPPVPSPIEEETDLSSVPVLRANRPPSHITRRENNSDYSLTEANLQRHNVQGSSVNPLAHAFMSPLDVLDRSYMR